MTTSISSEAVWEKKLTKSKQKIIVGHSELFSRCAVYDHTKQIEEKGNFTYKISYMIFIIEVFCS